MAARGTSKRRSVDQEEEVARLYRGKRSASSGAAAHDYGDVRTRWDLIECKYTQKPPKQLFNELEKIAKEAFAEGLEPVLCLRWHVPGSILADADGYIDLTVRRMCNDVERTDERWL